MGLGSMKVIKQLAGKEDLLTGVGSVTQQRATGEKEITKLNATHLEGAIIVDSIKDMLNLDINKLSDKAKIYVLGFYEPNDGGGGLFYFDANKPKTEHNGGTIIAYGKELNDLVDEDWFNPIDGNGCFIRVLENDYITPEMFGAKGDGITDDTLALKNTIYQKKNIIFNNNYLIGSLIYLSTTGYESKWLGNNSKIIVNSIDGGIFIDVTDRSNKLEINDLEFVANIKGVDFGLKINMVPGGNRHNRSLIIRDTRFSVSNENDTETYCYFNTALDIKGNWRPYLENVVISGVFGIDNDFSDASPYYKMQVGINADWCYNFEAKNCYIWSCNIGIKSYCDSDPGSEGFKVEFTNIVSCNIGIDFYRVGREPSLNIFKNHINYRDFGIRINGCKLFKISDNLIYNEDVNSIGIGTDIYLTNVEDFIIINNKFHFDGNNNRVGISLIGDTFNENGFISNNMFTFTIGKSAIFVGANVSIKNIFNNTSVVKLLEDNSNSVSTMYFNDNYLIKETTNENILGFVEKINKKSDNPTSGNNIYKKQYYANNSNLANLEVSEFKVTFDDVTAGSEKTSFSFYSSNGVLKQVLKLLADIDSGQTSAILLVNIDGALSTKQVLIGDADSAGTGYRQLMITN